MDDEEFIEWKIATGVLFSAFPVFFAFVFHSQALYA
jgi:hypothetical protein